MPCGLAKAARWPFDPTYVIWAILSKGHPCFKVCLSRRCQTKRSPVRKLCRELPNLHWMPDAGVVPLTGTTCLVGHDGWGDGRLGDYHGSDVLLNDFGDDRGDLVQSRDRLAKLHALGDEAADHLRTVLPDVGSHTSALRPRWPVQGSFDLPVFRGVSGSEVGRHHRECGQRGPGFQHVVVLTHVPPFREACWHEGKVSDDNWLPFFTCKAVGDALREAMAAAPDRRMTVLCGHTHGSGEAQILPNLRVLTGGAVYGKPCVQRVLEVE